MKHLTIARLFLFLGAGALLADVTPSRCGRAATPPATVLTETVAPSGMELLQ